MSESAPAQQRYDPWRDLAENWPQLEVVLKPMRGELLGELRFPVITLRADTSAAQRRCTLAHELVHLERGVRDCGPWSAREELHVHREVARRLIGSDDLIRAIRALGGHGEVVALARALDVDVQTAQIRLGLLTAEERARIQAVAAGELWRVA
jgi:hypothetical protein